MSDLFTNLGLRAGPVATAAPTYAPHFIIANFIISYAALSTRGTKVRLGLDNNVSPREDVAKADAAVRAGKITQADLDKLKRREAAHANAVENFPFFVGALVLALLAKLPNDMVNRYALVYTLVRIAYAVSYAQITDKTASYSRSVLWWAGNITCIRLLWFAGKTLNAV